MEKLKLPKGWITIELNELMAKTHSVNPNKTSKHEYELWSVPAFPFDNPEYLNGEEIGSNKQLVQPGDVLLCKINPRINRVWLVRDKIKAEQIASTEWIVLRFNELLPKFIMYQLREEGFRNRLLADLSGVGGSLTRARPRIVGKIEINIAPINEQKRIVAKIEDLQSHSRKAKKALETIPDLLEQLRQSNLAAAFRGDLTKKWREQHKGHIEPAAELLKRIRIERRKRWEAAELDKLKAKGLTGDQLDTQFAKRRKQYPEPASVDTTDLPELPEGWIWVSGECVVPVDAPIVYGIILPGPHIDDGVPYIRPLEIQNDVIVNHPIPKTSPEIAAKYERAKISIGDIILSIVGTIGKVAIVPERLNGGNITQSSARLRPWTDFITSGYLAEALRSPLLRSQYDTFRFGNAVQRLNIAHVRALAIPLPSADEQIEIVKAVQSRFQFSSQVMHVVESCMERINELSDIILAKAFRGELVHQDPNDEPASILLKRIHQKKERQIAAIKSKPKQKGRKMKRPKTAQQDIIAVLKEAARPMTPEELFSAGGFGEDSVDAFYEQLRAAITAKKIRETRKGATIKMEVLP